MTEKQHVREAAILIAALTTLLFIWGHSLAGSASSGAESGRFAALLLAILGEGNPVGDFIISNVRKLAHYTEYFLLGITAFLWIWNRRVSLPRVGVAAAIGVAVAIADEFLLQNIAHGRAPMWQDVGIDLAGFFTALALLLAGWTLTRAVRGTQARRDRA